MLNNLVDPVDTLESNDVLLLALGGEGTLGHQTIVHHLATALRDAGVRVSSIVESSQPSHFGNAITLQPPHVGTGSLGGRLLTSRLTAVEPYLHGTGKAVVFNTFFCSDIVDRARALGLRCILVTNYFRDTWQEIFECEQYGQLFDEVIYFAEPFDPSPGASVMFPFPASLLMPGPNPPKNDRPEIVALVGGGGLPSSVSTRTVFREALAELAGQGSVNCTLIQGPYSSGTIGGEQVSNLTEVASVPDVRAILRKSDLVVSEAGYGAVWESIVNTVPSILVPSFRNTDNQELRAYRVSKLGCAIALLGRQREDLHSTIERLLENPQLRATMRSACQDVCERFRRTPVIMTHRLFEACGLGGTLGTIGFPPES